MDNVVYVIVSLALILSVISIILSCVSISMIVGFKNSTHRIEWKPLPIDKEEVDPFADIDPTENPLKRKIKNPFPHEEVKEDEPFADLDDPNVISHDWA